MTDITLRRETTFHIGPFEPNTFRCIRTQLELQ